MMAKILLKKNIQTGKSTTIRSAGVRETGDSRYYGGPIEDNTWNPSTSRYYVVKGTPETPQHDDTMVSRRALKWSPNMPSGVTLSYSMLLLFDDNKMKMAWMRYIMKTGRVNRGM